jgi:Putative zinc-finger
MTTQGDDTGCATFEAALPDYLEGALGSAADVAARAHLATCEQCRTLVADLERIRTQAAGLPDLQPSRDLWAEIDARIETPAIAVDAGRRVGGSDRGLGRRGSPWSGWFGSPWSVRSGLRAAALIVATAGVTYLATRWWAGTPGGTTTIVQRSTTSPSSGSAATQIGPTAAVAAINVAPTAPTAPPATTTVSNRARTPAPASTSEFIYDQQIAALHQILQQRRVRLDPTTVAIVEKNLRLIDAAIAESKAALAKDPANAFLAQQLDQSLGTKLELLRTAALLPSRT